jgi:replicative DNA helicase
LTDLDNYRMEDKAPEHPEDAAEAALDRDTPANPAAEATLLGAVLLDPAAYNEIAEKLTADDFFLDAHRRIFRVIGVLIDAGSAVDIVTLTAELQRTGELSTVGGVAFIAGLTEGLPREPQITDYIRLVLDKSQLRRMIGLFNAAIARAQDQVESPLDILEDTEGSLLTIAQEANVGKLRTIWQSVEDAGGVDPYLKAYTEPEAKTGLQTGFVEFDQKTGGLQPAELVIVAARPAMGKTSFAINLMENVCCGSECVAAFFSLEMSRAAVERRFMASRAYVDVKRAMEGFFLSGHEKLKLARALDDLVGARIFIDDSSTLTPVQMRAKARRLKQREKRLDLVVVDYLQLLTAGHKTGSRQEEVASISRSLKACAKELNVPVVALAQLSRNSEQRQDKRPTLSDLRESGQIEQDADLVAFIHRDEYYQPDNDDVRGIADIIIGKARNGPTGIVKLAFQAALTRFDNLARR